MSRVQVLPTSYRQQRELSNRTAAVSRTTSRPVPDLDTTGMTSAQIDQAVFVGSQGGAQFSPYDGATITDATNNALLVRLNGKWAKAVLTTIP